MSTPTTLTVTVNSDDLDELLRMTARSIPKRKLSCRPEGTKRKFATAIYEVDVTGGEACDIRAFEAELALFSRCHPVEG